MNFNTKESSGNRQTLAQKGRIGLQHKRIIVNNESVLTKEWMFLFHQSPNVKGQQ